MIRGLFDAEDAGLMRVDQIIKTMELVYAEMEPGDGLFFHANVMHRSDQNRSPNRRWTVLFCFNAARNDPYVQHQHPGYTPLVKVPDSAVKAAGVKLSAPGAEQFRNASARPVELAAKAG